MSRTVVGGLFVLVDDLLGAVLVRLWPLEGPLTVRLVSRSENDVYGVRWRDGSGFLRLGRPGYQSASSTHSELHWLAAIARDTEVQVAEAITARSGEPDCIISVPDGERIAVLFRAIPGVEPQMGADLLPVFHQLGRYAARLHEHAARFVLPDGFTRPKLTGRTLLPAGGLWGDWRTSPDLDPSMRKVLEAACDRLTEELDRFGETADRFGLIHADMRLGNLLLGRTGLSLIDFDDCGFSYLLYDLAAALSFYETHTLVPHLTVSWLKGYREVRDLDEAMTAVIPALVLLRRFALLAWIGTHADTGLARRHRPGFAEGTLHLAQAYLKRG